MLRRLLLLVEAVLVRKSQPATSQPAISPLKSIDLKNLKTGEVARGEMKIWTPASHHSPAPVTCGYIVELFY